MPIELMGQGEPLLPDFSFQGEWMLWPRVFLYMPSIARTLPVDVPQFTVLVNAGQEDWALGFDASHMAAAFETTIEAMRAANVAGELTLENVLTNTPNGEGATKKLYVFGYRGKTIDMVVEALPQTGTA